LCVCADGKMIKEH